MHGAAAPQVKRAAQQRLLESRLEGEVGALLRDLRIEPLHPIETLLQGIDLAAAMVTLLRELVGALPLRYDAAMGAEDGSRPAALYGPDHLGDARPHVLVIMLGEWLDRSARLSKIAMDVGVDSRRLQLVEAQAAQLVAVVRATTTQLAERARAVHGPDFARLIDELVHRDLPAILAANLEAAGRSNEAAESSRPWGSE